MFAEGGTGKPNDSRVWQTSESAVPDTKRHGRSHDVRKPSRGRPMPRAHWSVVSYPMHTGRPAAIVPPSPPVA